MRKKKPLADLLAKAYELLDSGKPIYSDQSLRTSIAEFKEVQLLTAKPIIYLFNVDESLLTNTGKQAELSALVALTPPHLFVPS